MVKKRLFVAIDVPEPVIKHIQSLQHALVAHHLFEGRLTKPEHMHLTLKFIGEVDEATHQRVQEKLRSIVFPSLQACLGKLGMFSVKGHPSIIWVSLEGEGIAPLERAIEEVLGDLVPHEAREFVSHLTIARVKSVPDIPKLQQYLEQAVVSCQPFTITEFVLKDSVLSDDGPYYTVRERYALTA